VNLSRFLLGTHQPGWLARASVPLFVSDRRLRTYKTLPVAIAAWGLDSGGFTELQQFGAWTVTPAEYVARVRRYRDDIGHLAWAAPQDWMCEPIVINGGRIGPITFAGTHLSVAEHQRRTVANFVQLRDLAPDLPFIPVVQGWPRPASTSPPLHWSASDRSAGAKAPPLAGKSSPLYTSTASPACTGSGSKPLDYSRTATP
jgi:hypothetical protein